MGYETRYSLELDTWCGDIMEDLLETVEEAKYAFDANGESEAPVKWYSSERDMREFSKRHPFVLFTLSGEGEESGDLWKAYFRDGLMQLAKADISYAPFNSDSLI